MCKSCSFRQILREIALFSVKKLHSWHKFYTTAGRDDRDKFQLCPPTAPQDKAKLPDSDHLSESEPGEGLQSHSQDCLDPRDICESLG